MNLQLSYLKIIDPIIYTIPRYAIYRTIVPVQYLIFVIDSQNDG